MTKIVSTSNIIVACASALIWPLLIGIAAILSTSENELLMGFVGLIMLAVYACNFLGIGTTIALIITKNRTLGTYLAGMIHIACFCLLHCCSSLVQFMEIITTDTFVAIAGTLVVLGIVLALYIYGNIGNKTVNEQLAALISLRPSSYEDMTTAIEDDINTNVSKLANDPVRLFARINTAIGFYCGYCYAKNMSSDNSLIAKWTNKLPTMKQ